MKAAHAIAFILVIIGGLNWLLVGFNWNLVDAIFGAGSTGIAHFAHIGGAITGFIMMWYWKKNQFNNKRWN